jgi:hypothetical protein
MIRKSVVGIALLSSLAAGTAFAQAGASAAGTTIPVRVQVVLTRYDGEKKVSSMPNELWVNVSDDPKARNHATLRIGVSVPVSVVANNTVTVAFKDVGNRVDCQVVRLADGRFRLDLLVEQSSVDNALRMQGDSGKSGTPMLRDFGSSFMMDLRDGQTAQSSSAADPVTGEVLKVTVTLNVVK